MSNQVVTIGYLKSFVSGKLTVSTSQDDTYCPTYAELTGGALVPNYSKGANPKDTVNGIHIPDCTVDIGYRADQLVIRQDLLLKYMVFDALEIKANSTDIDKCGGSTDICATATFHLVTKSEEGETDGSAETDKTVPVTWDGNADNSGPSTCTTISFDLNAVGGAGTANPTSAPSRTESTKATFSYSGTNLTSENVKKITSNTVTVTQGANNVGEWYYEGATDYATSLVVNCPSGYISENGGSATITSTLYYEQDWRADDECGNTVGYKYVSASKSGPSDTVSFDEQECDADERSETKTLSMSGQSNSCTVYQEASSVPCFCGGGCPDASCNGKVHWGCAAKKGDTLYEYNCSTAKINGSDPSVPLPATGGTATVTIEGTAKKGIWTRSAICGYESLPVQIVDSLPSLPNTESSQNTVYLLPKEKGKTGGTLYYYDSDGDRHSTYSYTYTSYTQYHYTVWLEDVTIGKKTIKEEKWGWVTLGESIERIANSVTSYESTRYRYYCDSGNACVDKRDEFINDGNSASTWDNAYSSWYEKWVKYQNSEKFYCEGEEVATEEEMLNCEGEQERHLDESLNPGEFSIYGYYYAPTTEYGDGTDEGLTRVTACCVRNISSESDYLVDHLSTGTPITGTATFTYAANPGAQVITGSTTVTLNGGKTCNVEYKVANGSTAANNCADVEVNGRDWSLSLPYAAESDVTFTFAAKNGYVSGGTTGANWTQTVTVNKGSKTGSARSNITQHATGATFVSVSPTGDSKYAYCVNSISCGAFEDVYVLSVTQGITLEAPAVEGYMTVTSTKNGSPYSSFTFSENCSWVSGFQILNPSSTNGVYNVQITTQANSENVDSRTCNVTVTQTNGKTDSTTITQNGNLEEGNVCMDVIINNDNGCVGDLLFFGSDGSKISELSIDNGNAVTLCHTKGDTVTFNMRDYDNTSASLNSGGSSFRIIEGGQVYINITCDGGGGGGDTGTTSCTCSVTSISVSPTSYTFTSTTEEKEFKVTINNNGCENCRGYHVYYPDGRYMGPGTNNAPFTLYGSSPSGNYKVEAMDNTAKTATVNVAINITPTCNDNWNYDSATLTFDASMDACDTIPTVSNVTISNVLRTYQDCSTSYIPEYPTSDYYTVKCSPEGKNTGSARNVKVTVKTDSLYGSMETSKTITQAGGCVVAPTYTGSSTEYDMQVVDTSVDKCATSAPSITVQGRNRTVSGYSDGTKTEGNWSSWTNLTKDTHYTISVPSISKNTGSTSKSYTVTATGKSNYASIIRYGTITQAGGCVVAPTYTGSTTEYNMRVVDTTVEACATSAPSITVQGCSRVVSGYSDGSVSPTGDTGWSSWTTLSSSNYTLNVPAISKNTGSTSKSYTVTATGKSNYASLTRYGTITQASGCVTSCTTSFTCSSIDASVSAGKCDTTPSVTVTANGTYKNTACTETASSTTISDYTIKYGKTNGSYTLTSITTNETTSEVTWYYKVTAGTAYGSKTTTGQFKQEAGKCTPVYTFTDITPASNSTVSSSAGGHSIHVTSTKNGANYSSITSSESCSWLTVYSPSLSGSYYYIPFDVTENTSTSSRSCNVKLTQGESGKEVTVTITQEGKPATCDCSTVSISCSPSNSYTTGNSVSTIVTVKAGNNCSTKWKAYSSSGSYLGEGESGKSLSRTTTGTVTFRSDACSDKITTWTISKPECAKPTIRLSGSGDGYMLQSYYDTDEWCGTNPNVSVSTSADYIGDGSDYTHYSPTTCSFEIANCGASITSFKLDSGGWILESYSGLNSFGIGFTIRPDAIINATCVLSGSFTYLMQGTPFSGTFSISIQFNG